ncbi:hypothetical protein H9P43_006030 [Blastocladiella emersonii ATCC 22665]|nr:hypothetical protein H9P43_006030 [Blastocladiella emersonii ATCC 22665]
MAGYTLDDREARFFVWSTVVGVAFAVLYVAMTVHILRSSTESGSGNTHRPLSALGRGGSSSSSTKKKQRGALRQALKRFFRSLTGASSSRARASRRRSGSAVRRFWRRVDLRTKLIALAAVCYFASVLNDLSALLSPRFPYVDMTAYSIVRAIFFIPLAPLSAMIMTQRIMIILFKSQETRDRVWTGVLATSVVIHTFTFVATLVTVVELNRTHAWATYGGRIWITAPNFIYPVYALIATVYTLRIAFAHSHITVNVAPVSASVASSSVTAAASRQTAAAPTSSSLSSDQSGGSESASLPSASDSAASTAAGAASPTASSVLAVPLKESRRSSAPKPGPSLSISIPSSSTSSALSTPVDTVSRPTTPLLSRVGTLIRSNGAAPAAPPPPAHQEQQQQRKRSVSIRSVTARIAPSTLGGDTSTLRRPRSQSEGGARNTLQVSLTWTFKLLSVTYVLVWVAYGILVMESAIFTILLRYSTSAAVVGPAFIVEALFRQLVQARRRTASRKASVGAPAAPAANTGAAVSVTSNPGGAVQLQQQQQSGKLGPGGGGGGGAGQKFMMSAEMLEDDAHFIGSAIGFDEEHGVVTSGPDEGAAEPPPIVGARDDVAIEFASATSLDKSSPGPDR